MDQSAIDQLASAVLGRDVRALARASTVVERQNAESQRLVSQIFSHTGDARVLGITGPPGVGKSTLVNQLTSKLRSMGHRVAILAIDPSSPVSKGAILGDRIRLSQHHHDIDVFLRSIATRGFPGGLAAAALDLALLFDAAGFHFVIVETVGAGQGETAISNFADITMVVLTPSGGDDVQAIKAGLMEIADIFVINKSDLVGAENLDQQIRFVQSLSPSDAAPPPIHRVIAIDGSGINPLVSDMLRLMNGRKRRLSSEDAWKATLPALIERELRTRLRPESLAYQASRLAARDASPHEAVSTMLLEMAHSYAAGGWHED